MRIKHKYSNYSKKSVDRYEQNIELKSVLNVLVIFRCLIEFGVEQDFDIDHPRDIRENIHIKDNKTDDIHPKSPCQIPIHNRLSFKHN